LGLVFLSEFSVFLSAAFCESERGRGVSQFGRAVIPRFPDKKTAFLDKVLAIPPAPAPKTVRLPMGLRQEGSAWFEVENSGSILIGSRV
jgi:hypothetical protein